MRICPNDKFIEIFAQRFHYFEDPFYKFFALNLLFQDISCSLALKYSSFLVKFFSFAFHNIASKKKQERLAEGLLGVGIIIWNYGSLSWSLRKCPMTIQTNRAKMFFNSWYTTHYPNSHNILLHNV